MALANFIRQGSTAAAVVVNFTVGGTATLNTDYSVTFPSGITGTWGATSGSVTIPSGASQVDVTVNPIGDSTLESDETVIVTITTSTPSTPVSSSNGAALLVITNDDFITRLKVLGAGTTSGTALVGVINNANGNSFGTQNTGTAPVNWSNWVVSLLAGGNTLYNTSATPSVPYLLKAVLRAPTFTPTNTTTRYSLFDPNSSTRRVGFVGNANATWDLIFYDGSVTQAPFLTIPAIAIGAWFDLIMDVQTGLTTFNVNGLTSVSTSNNFPLAGQLNIFMQGSIGLAAVAVNVGQSYSPLLFPITPANL